MKNKIPNRTYLRNKTTTIFFIIGLARILFLTNCTQQSAIKATTTPAIPPVSYIGSGIAIGIREFRDSPVWRTYRVSSNSGFKAYLRLLNQRSAEKYLFTCLIDYRQTPCSFEDHEEMTVLYPIDMAENEDRLIPFKTPPLSNGFHDFAILVFASPDRHDLDDSYRLSTDLNYFYAPRVELHVGASPYPPAVMDFEKGQAWSNTGSKNNGVVINTVPDSRIIPGWFSQTVKPGETIDYFIHLGNDTDPDQTYVVMSFLDFFQIPVSENQENHYIALKTGERIEIPAQFTAPMDQRVHELMVVLARRPFQPMEVQEEGNKRDLIKGNFDIENSIRVGIEVHGENQ